jgi:hypothetical protein
VNLGPPPQLGALFFRQPEKRRTDGRAEAI